VAGRFLMTDDLSMLVGELRGGFRALLERVDRSDEQTAEKINGLVGQHKADKEAAILARDAKEAREDIKHEENQRAIETVRTEFQAVALQGANNAAWIKDEGRPGIADLRTRVTAIEGRRAAEKYQALGAAKTWAFIGVIGAAIGGVLTAILTYGRDTIDWLKEIGQ
jgi:hypothetical protein